MSHSVTLEPASKSRHDLIANLMQLYLHDLSEFTQENVSDMGTFEYPYLDLYRVEPERHPILILVGEEVAGFALVRGLAPDAYELAEFFVLRQFRGRKVGAQAAFDLFRRFQGTWHVAQEESNTPAQKFWRAVIGRFTNGDFVEEQSEQQPHGPRQIFNSSNG